MTTAAAAYQHLLDHLRTMTLVADCRDLLEWDELTRLPDAATDYRGRQLAYLAGRYHDLATEPRLGEWLTVLETSPLSALHHPHATIERALAGEGLPGSPSPASPFPTTPAAINIRHARRQYDRLTRVPRRLVEELASVVTVAQHQWKLARQEDRFERFQPWLALIVLLKREEALCLGGPTVYDALLAEYEPGISTAEVTQHFEELGRELSSLRTAALAAQQRSSSAGRRNLLLQEFPIAAQQALCEELARALGYEFTRGGMATCAHPFTTLLGPHDCRIALRFQEHDLREGLFGVLHELGHALYDQSLPGEHYGTPLGEAPSLSVHESQGRLWENAVGRSRGFWRYLQPRLAVHFPAAVANASADELWRAVNDVQPGMNRVRADELTYNLHILVRFEIEQALLLGDLAVADLPEAWNAGYQKYLGITPRGDQEGCLQDGHWAAGMFGYFPTYTLGNLIAAQLIAQAEADVGPLEEQFARGQFQPLREWLSSRIYRHGKRYSTLELVQHATGHPLSHQPLVDHLQRRQMELWLDS
jgi:carboxypeptidase Taq